MTILTGIDPHKLIDQSQVSFPHPIDDLELIETHISWILLTGNYAYKMKKPVKFDFVDYSTIQMRQHFCEQEVITNQRYAGEIYLGVVPIYQVKEGYWFGELPQSENRPIDYAVKMEQFSGSALVASRLECDQMTSLTVDQFGRDLAQFHRSIGDSASPSEFGSPDSIGELSDDNFAELLKAFQATDRETTVIELKEWSQQELSRRRALIDQRQKLNFVRPGHGDLHLKNIIQLPNGRLLPFDGIEFNDALQWNDIISEIAFPVMDFCARGRSDLGWRLYNAWMEEINDVDSVQLLRFFVVYRAMVRAKVTWLNPAHHSQSSIQAYQNPDAPTADPLAGPWDRYLKVAAEFAFSLRPSLVITHGFSGSGKSTAAMKWIERFGGVRIRSDWVRKNQFGHLDLDQRYSSATTEQVYHQLYRLAQMSIDSRISPVVDATFLRRSDRTRFRELASKNDIPFEIIDCSAPLEELIQRLQSRKGDLSEATIEVLKNQFESHDPLTSAEHPFMVKSDEISRIKA